MSKWPKVVISDPAEALGLLESAISDPQSEYSLHWRQTFWFADGSHLTVRYGYWGDCHVEANWPGMGFEIDIAKNGMTLSRCWDRSRPGDSQYIGGPYKDFHNKREFASIKTWAAKHGLPWKVFWDLADLIVKHRPAVSQSTLDYQDYLKTL